MSTMYVDFMECQSHGRKHRHLAHRPRETLGLYVIAATTKTGEKSVSMHTL